MAGYVPGTQRHDNALCMSPAIIPVMPFILNFHRAMHYSAKRGIAIACRPSICLSVCNVGGSGSHRLEILETNCTDN